MKVLPRFKQLETHLLTHRMGVLNVYRGQLSRFTVIRQEEPQPKLTNWPSNMATPADARTPCAR